MTTIYIATNLGTQFDKQIDITGTYTSHIPPGNSGIWTWVVEKYGFIRQTGTFNAAAVTFSPELNFLVDAFNTESDREIVEAYPKFNTLDELYNYSVYIRTQEPEVVRATKDGNILDFGSMNLVISPSATEVWDINETTNTLTIKADILNAGTIFKVIRTSGTIQILSGSLVKCIYVSDQGPSQTVELRNVPPGSSVAVYNIARELKLFESNVAGGLYTLYIEPGISETWYWAIETYGKNRNSGDFPTDVGGVIFLVPDNVTDVNITQTDLSIVQAYTSISTLDQLYDVAAAYRLTQEGIVFGDKFTESSDSLIMGNTDFVLNSAATSVYQVTETQIIVKSSTLSFGTKFTQLVSTGEISNTTDEIFHLSAVDSTGTSSLLTITGVTPGVVVKLMSGSTEISSGVSTGTSVVIPYVLGAGITTTNAMLYAGKAANNIDGFNVFSGSVILNQSLTSTLINMVPDTFYGRSGASADRENVSVSWSTSGVPTITLTGDTDIKSIYDELVESHATTQNVSYFRPTTNDGNVYQFGASNFQGSGRITGSTQFYTTGTVNVLYVPILNTANTINFPAGSLVKVTLDSDNSTVVNFGVNLDGKLELTFPPNSDYRIYIKTQGYAPKVVLLNSGTGRVVTINPSPQKSFSASTDISDLIPLIRTEVSSNTLNVYLGNMQVTPLKVVAIVDYLQQQEDYVDVSLVVGVDNILYINDTNQITPIKQNVKLYRETTLPTNKTVMWQVYFNSGALSYPDLEFTPEDSNQLHVNSFSSAQGLVVIADSQISTIATTAVNEILSHILNNGKSVGINISETNILTNIISSEVQKPD